MLKDDLFALNSITRPLWALKNKYEKTKLELINKKIIEHNSLDKLMAFDDYLFNFKLIEYENLYQPGKKLIGLYEYEVKSFILNNLADRQYNNLVSIGASDGLEARRYAGLLNILNVELYDTDKSIYHDCWKHLFEGYKLECHASVNANSNIQCLQDKHNKSLVFIDIEGYEFEFLKNQLHTWNNCDVIVEVHTGDMFDINYEWNNQTDIKSKGFIPIVSEFYKSKKVMNWVNKALPFLSDRDANRLLYEIRTFSIGWCYIEV